MIWFELSMTEQFNVACFGIEMFPDYAQRIDPEYVRLVDPLAYVIHQYRL